MKKINIYIIAGIIAFIGLVFFILFSFGIIKTTPSSETTFSKIEVGEKVFFPQLSQDGSYLYYFGNQGVKLKKFNISTKKVEILYPDDLLYTVHTLWSPNKNKIIINNNTPYTSTPNQVLDINQKKLINLPNKVKNIIWAKDDKNIYYQYFDQDKNLNYLASANYDGNNEQKLIDLKYIDYDFMWLNNFQKLGYWSAPQDTGGTKLYALNLSDNSISTIFEDYKLNNALSPINGQHFVYNNFDDSKGVTISYAKDDGTNNKDLGYETSIQKTVWSADGSFFIVAVKEKETENDKFYKVEVKNNKITNLSYSTEKNQEMITAENLMLSTDNKTLYFTSSDILYNLQLP